MGKPYRDELRALAQTTHEAYSLPVDPLRRAVEDSSGCGLVIVASGGSQTVANLLADLHQDAVGHPCRVVTPLVFQGSRGYGQRHVWLLSAGGRNSDILSAARHAIASGAESITALVAALDSPLQELLEAYGASRTIAFEISAGSDGFLATNSLWASCLLLERAYGAAFNQSEILPDDDARRVLTWAEGVVDEVTEWSGDIVGIGDPYTMVGLSDLDMRATEAALANIWVTDLRNLGHGRHYWFASRGARTRALCLVSEPYRSLCEQTAELIGDATHVHVVDVPASGPAARLASIAFSIYAALRLGEQLQIDPGKPGVPAFGESLYELTVRRSAPVFRADSDEEIILSKLGRRHGILTESERQYWSPHLAQFRATLLDAEISAVVFDFDGTLIESSRRYAPMDRAVVNELRRLLESGIQLGIATGRGDSCGDELRKQLPPDQWNKIVVGYHNGASIQPLSEVGVSNGDVVPVIEEAAERLKRLVMWPGRGRCRTYAMQCSISVLDGRDLSEAWCQTHAALRDLVEDGHLRVWKSSHSIDVVVSGVSKRSVVSFIASQANCLPEQVLCFGDRGRWPGNDTELLESPLSLSADQCSLRRDRCWNLAGLKHRQVAATCHQLRMFNAASGVLRFREDWNAREHGSPNAEGCDGMGPG